MALAAFPELARIRTLVKRARLLADAEHSILWCLDQLPHLYAEFCRTCESRFGDAILRLAQAVLKKLAESGVGAATLRVSAALVAQLAGLHERLGLSALALRPVSASAAPGKKATA
jgi:hypothetical protein